MKIRKLIENLIMLVISAAIIFTWLIAVVRIVVLYKSGYYD